MAKTSGAIPHAFVVADDLVDHEAQELFGEIRVEPRRLGERPQAGDLLGLARGVGRGQAGGRLVAPDRLGDLEPLGEQEDQRRVDIVDALAKFVELRVGHCRLLPRPVALMRVDRVGCKSPACLCGAERPKRGAMVATVTPLHRKSVPSLDPMIQLVAADMNQVNKVILARMQSDVPLIPELAGHLIAGGGKRMRPMLTLACARLLDYPGGRHHKLAAAVEFIHTATLLHDDVVDGSGLRRGRRTANIIWGNPASVLVGDFLFSRAFELMVEDGSLRVLKTLSHASAVIAEGEVNQLTAQRRIETSEERYLDIIGAKTAALFAAACRIAAIVAERDLAIEDALDSYGRNLGIAFQLVDDAIDYASDEATMGKDAGDDFRDGKVTLPVILAHARGSDAERRFWREAMEGHRTSDADLAHATGLLAQTDAIADTLDRARHYGQRAIDALAGVGSGPAKAALVEAVEFAVARAY